MTTQLWFEVERSDLGETRLSKRDLAPLGENEIRVRINEFALTANNITYGVVGERIGYWKFFPAEGGYGVIPVWGVAEVAESKVGDLDVGEKIYGYFPTGDTLVMNPDRIRPGRFVDAAAHRAELPPVYNTYARLAAEEGYDARMDRERMLLYPLYATSYCLYDFFQDNDWFGAKRVIVVSASSKTAIGVGYAFAADRNAPETLGLTSARNVDFVTSLDLYDEVATYDDADAIDASVPTAIIDMSGNGDVLGALHKVLGDNMRFTSNVGLTHWDDNQMTADFIRERSAMFFAPGHIQKRAADWGPGAFEKKSLAFWKDAAVRSRDWLDIEIINGLENFDAAYQKMLGGGVDPKKGLIVRP